jgi:hypothetical protein
VLKAAAVISLIIAAASFAPSHSYAKGPAGNFVDSSGGVYFYEPALSEVEKRAGLVAAELTGFRYFGRNEAGEHVVAAVDSSGRMSWTAACENPCLTVRLSDGRRFKNRPRLLLSAVFEDALRGRLANTNPVLAELHVPSEPPIAVNGRRSEDLTDSGALRLVGSGSNDVYPLNSGLVIEAGFFPRYGNYVKIDHGASIVSIIGNLDTVPDAKGMVVSRSTKLGEAKPAPDGKPMVIVEVRVEGMAVNPIPYVYASCERQTDASLSFRPLPSEGRQAPNPDSRFLSLFEAWSKADLSNTPAGSRC